MSPEDQSSAPQTCPVGMSDLKPCGRPTHHAPQGVDDEPVCLMHSLDPDKDKLKFREEIDAILNATSSYHRPTDRFDFEKFVFPEADFGGTTFTRDADFRRAKFTEAADFRGAKFTKGADFTIATFIQGADFFAATFTEAARFSGATFTKAADFRGATFTEAARFSGATFTKAADFHGATFTKAADFRRTRFEQPTRVHFVRVNQHSPEAFRVRFLDCRVEEVHFEDVTWDKEGPRMVLQDELDILSGESKEHELVAVAYRQLINNFERSGPIIWQRIAPSGQWR